MNNDFVVDSVEDLINSIGTTNSKIHIRIKQRNNKKSTTSIEQLPKTVNLQTALKEMRQKFGCLGSIQESESCKFIQLSGDQRVTAKKYLISNLNISEEDIITHGY